MAYPSIFLVFVAELHVLTCCVQGAGETLRGTFNQAIDKRVGQNPEAMAKNNQVLDGGRQEIESARLGDHSKTQGGTNPKGILRKSGGQGQLRVVNE